MKRGNGILMHISSLPAEFGIGDLGPQAYKFVDFLYKAKQHYWQILPLTPTEIRYGNSPYSSPSAFAGNILLISPQKLFDDGLLEKEDLNVKTKFTDTIDFNKVTFFKKHLLKKAYKNFGKNKNLLPDFEDFVKNQAYWLDDYAIFVGLRQQYKGKFWNKWPKLIRERNKLALRKIIEDCRYLHEEIKFQQYIFYRQWNQLKEYCHKKRIRIIGDIPIYVNFDSADVWKNQSIFKLNVRLEPKFVAGVPPDYFSKTGQRWGNPVYDWSVLKQNNFEWWINRIKHNLTMYDCVRIDHFRGFAAFWQVPAKEKTAMHGRWVPALGSDLFNTVKKKYPRAQIIAEDIGYITPDVHKLMKDMKFPGMKVLQFAFGDFEYYQNYLPSFYPKNSVAYTGTHDNNTLKGWYETEISEHQRTMINNFLGKKIQKKDVTVLLMKELMKSKADVSIVPLQDVLGLGCEGRMNRPGKAKGNWTWRLKGNALQSQICKKLESLTINSLRA